jgi:hypothetical protein
LKYFHFRQTRNHFHSTRQHNDNEESSPKVNGQSKDGDDLSGISCDSFISESDNELKRIGNKKTKKLSKTPPTPINNNKSSDNCSTSSKNTKILNKKSPYLEKQFKKSANNLVNNNKISRPNTAAFNNQQKSSSKQNDLFKEQNNRYSIQLPDVKPTNDQQWTNGNQIYIQKHFYKNEDNALPSSSSSLASNTVEIVDYAKMRADFNAGVRNLISRQQERAHSAAKSSFAVTKPLNINEIKNPPPLPQPQPITTTTTTSHRENLKASLSIQPFSEMHTNRICSQLSNYSLNSDNNHHHHHHHHQKNKKDDKFILSYSSKEKVLIDKLQRQKEKSHKILEKSKAKHNEMIKLSLLDTQSSSSLHR